MWGGGVKLQVYEQSLFKKQSKAGAILSCSGVDEIKPNAPVLTNTNPVFPSNHVKLFKIV